MSALAVACSFTEPNEEIKKLNHTLLIAILQCNPNINLPDKIGRTPLMHAANAGNETAVELLIQYGYKNPHQALNG